MIKFSAVPVLAMLIAAGPGQAAPGDAADARAILEKGVAFDTVKGRGKVPAYAEYLKSALVGAGFAAGDIAIEPVGETANLHLVWKGKGNKPPMAITGHMDVVEADPKDWVRDPFKAIEDGGYLFGRGVGDNKFDVSMVVATLAKLKSSGFVPGRDIHLFLSGDEETDGTTAVLQAKQAKAAGVDFMLNSDGGGGALDTGNTPIGYGLSAAEKTYVDYRITVTNPGGHSSRPTSPNAIAQIGTAAGKISDYRFKPQINHITRASLTAEGTKIGGAMGAAMLAFAKNPSDAAAIATLSAAPGGIGQIATTCVPTMITGGHAPNALPQKAELTINCRIFPGFTVAAVTQELRALISDPAIKIEAVLEWPSPPPSPLRGDIMAAVGKAVSANRPGVAVTPVMDSGASDSVFYRALGIPSYGTSALFMREEDAFAHGLNERIPLAAIAPALRHWQVLITELAK
ncbi:peptidase M20 [Polymorphobacter glacialis]|uniref:Peptidase M20 n=1 Tax=Sandarakinorhabdus glacialis TaxID=1614636 RepID=A0A916ZSL4_9SPHN|nr:M20/M25/M40 family metallo-hydrolase [Polymorphobacter glacialis]GGE10525.1 peptidase M20 [Polymorphobacter glacialis]